MRTYYDTGVLLKLYTNEPESEPIQQFVHRRAETLRISDFQMAECISAFRLKHFRKECTQAQATKALDFLKEDLRNGVLQWITLDWTPVWIECQAIANLHAAATGARTLDTLHVASAKWVQAKEFITTDQRQSALARHAGLKVINPVKP